MSWKTRPIFTVHRSAVLYLKLVIILIWPISERETPRVSKSQTTIEPSEQPAASKVPRRLNLTVTAGPSSSVSSITSGKSCSNGSAWVVWVEKLMLASRPSSQAWRERIQVWEQSNGVIIRRDVKDWRRTDRLVRDSCWSLFKGPLFVVPPAMSGVNGLVRVIDAKKERERLNWAPKQKYELPVVNSNFGGVTLFFLKRQTRCALRLFFFLSPFLPHSDSLLLSHSHSQHPRLFHLCSLYQHYLLLFSTTSPVSPTSTTAHNNQ